MKKRLIGEASAIALAKEITQALLIIDDLRGRKLAADLHLPHTGTLGMLLLAKQRGIIDFLKLISIKYRKLISEFLLYYCRISYRRQEND